MNDRDSAERQRLSAERLFGLQAYLERARKLVYGYNNYNPPNAFPSRIKELEDFIKVTESILLNTEHLRDWDTVSRLIVRGKQLNLDEN